MKRASSLDFAEVNLEVWTQKVSELLRGRDPFEALKSTTRDGLPCLPLYTSENSTTREIEWDLAAPYVFRRGAMNAQPVQYGWTLGSVLRADSLLWREDLQQRVALFELSHGQPLWEAHFIAQFCQDLTDHPVVVAFSLPEDAGDQGDGYERWLVERKRRQLSSLNIWRNRQGGLDAALRGKFTLADTLRRNARTLISALDKADGTGTSVKGDRSFAVAPSRLHNLGATSAQEVAWALAATLHWLREYDGNELERLLGSLVYHWAFDSEYFEQVAKIRAFRMLWMDLLKQCGVDPPSLVIKGETSQRMLSTRDAWNNVVRSTLAVASAALAGVDYYVDTPFNARYAEPTYTSHRLARTVQLTLQEESYLSRVQDPLGGSWYIEELTQAIADRAWELLQNIEAQGGQWTALAKGWWAKHILEQQQVRRQQYAKRRPVIVGVSDFVSGADEQTATRSAAEASLEGALRDFFDSQDFETLLERNHQYGQEPVWILNWGSLVEHNARTIFAVNFLGVGGFSPVQSASLNTLAAIQEAWPTSGSQHVLICSSDEKYQSDLVGVATTLKKLGAKSLWLAGPPPGEEQILRDWKQAGLDGYVFRGCDVLQTLRELGLAMGRSL